MVLLESLRESYDEADQTVHFVAINAEYALAYQEQILELGAFPMFQDTEEEDAFGQHGGKAHDYFVYLPDHTLYARIEIGDDAWDDLEGVIDEALTL